MGRGMNLYALMSPTMGLQERVPKELLRDYYSPESLNIEIHNGTVRSRRGLNYQTSLPIQAEIMQAFLYEPFSGDREHILFTAEDIYAYNPSTGTVSFITPRYADGQATVTNGSTTVTGSGTLWSSNVKAGDYFGVGSDIDSITNWYRIQSVDSDTQLTLEEAYQEASQSGVSYVIRKVFTTESGDVWRVIQFTDSIYGDIVIATNGRDNPVRYHIGDSSVTEVSGMYPCKDVVVFKDRLIAIHTNESGSWQTQRYRWSDVGDCETWDALSFQDLVDTKGQLVCGVLSENSDFLVLFKNDSKYLIRWIGGDYVFDNQRINLIGTIAPNSVVAIPGQGFFYYGSDTRLRMFSGVEDVDIGYNVWSTVNNTNISAVAKIHAHYIYYKEQLRVFLPIVEETINTCMVYDFENKNWQKWEYKKEITAAVEGWVVSTYYCDEPPAMNWYCDEVDGYTDSREYLSSSPLTYYFDSAGRIYTADQGLQDYDEIYTSTFITNRLNFRLPQRYKRLWKVQLWFDSIDNTVDVSVRGDDSLYWAQTETISTYDSDKDVAKTEVVFDYNSENFDIKIEGSPVWQLIGMLIWWAPSYSVV